MIKCCIGEYSETDTLEIARKIRDFDNKRTYASDLDLLDSDVDMLNLEKQLGIDKRKMILDSLFEVDSVENRTDLVNLNSIDFEMQQSDPLNSAKNRYNVLSRATVYASIILSSMLLSGENYDKLHKVYSIWFCNYELRDIKTVGGDTLNNRAIHHIHMMSDYKDVNGACTFESANLLEVIIVELPKLLKSKDKFNSVLHELFFNTRNSVTVLEKGMGLTLSKCKEVAKIMTLEERIYEADRKDWEARHGRELIKEGIQKGIKEGIQKGILESVIKVIENLGGPDSKNAINMAMTIFKDEELIKEASRIIRNNTK